MDVLQWYGSMWDEGGYSHLNRGFIKRLSNKGYEVYCSPIQTKLEGNSEDLDFIKKHIFTRDKAFGKNVIRIIGHIPLNNIPKDAKNVIFTMLETRTLGRNFVNVCNKDYDFVLTPTEYYKNQFIQNGVEKPVYAIPIGIDECFFNENKEDNEINFNYKIFSKNKRPIKPEGFKFISVFRWNFRKGPEFLIKAFLRTFKDEDNVSLILYSKNMEFRKGPSFLGYVENKLKQVYSENATSESPPIYLCEDIIPQKIMPQMYLSGNCFVLSTLGEGFGLPILEASMMGLPIITTNNTSMTDYCNHQNSFLIDEGNQFITYEKKPEWYRDDLFIKEYVGLEFPLFGENYIENLSEKMKFVKNNYEESKIKNENLKNLIKNQYNWDVCINKFELFLKENFKIDILH